MRRVSQAVAEKLSTIEIIRALSRSGWFVDRTSMDHYRVFEEMDFEAMEDKTLKQMAAAIWNAKVYCRELRRRHVKKYPTRRSV